MNRRDRDDVFLRRLKDSFAVPVPETLLPEHVERLLLEEGVEKKKKSAGRKKLLLMAATFVVALGCVLAVYSDGLQLGGTKNADMSDEMEMGDDGVSKDGFILMQESNGVAPETSLGGNGSAPDEMPTESYDMGETERDGVHFVAKDGKLIAYDRSGTQLASAIYGARDDAPGGVVLFGEYVAVAHTSGTRGETVGVFVYDSANLVFLRDVAVGGAIRWISGDDASMAVGFIDTASGAERRLDIWVEDGSVRTEFSQ